MECPEDQYELYAQFGIASEKAQCLEMDAGNALLSYVTMFIPNEKIDAEISEWFRHLVEDVNRRTLGNLLTKVRDMGILDQFILDAVNDALERRNYLMHRFFPAHNFAIFSAEGRRTMTAELRDIQQKLDRARIMLMGMASTMEQFAGREARTQEFLDRLGADGKRVGI